LTASTTTLLVPLSRAIVAGPLSPPKAARPVPPTKVTRDVDRFMTRTTDAVASVTYRFSHASATMHEIDEKRAAAASPPA
jgi:hypothetical protein